MMVDGRGWRILLCTAMAVIGSALVVGCSDHPGDQARTTTETDPVVAVIDGVSITAHEIDDSIRPELDRIDRSRYELRARQLRRLIATRVLGKEQDDADADAAFAAARARADIEIRLAPPPGRADDGAHAGAVPRREDLGRTGNGEMAQSNLPIVLVGTIVRDEPAKSMAAVRVRGALLARNVQPGQTIVDGAVLERVDRNRIVLQRNGALEFVPLAVNSAAITPTPARTLARFVPTPDTVVSLRRADVDRALRDLPGLERSLAEAPAELDGRRLLVVTTAEPGSLYDLLQLQDRDVLMQVNGEWVDDSRNPLWDTLRSDDTVMLMIMRAGHPQSFAYTIN